MVREKDPLLLKHTDIEKDYSFYQARSNLFDRFQLFWRGNYEIGPSVRKHFNGQWSKGMAITLISMLN